MEIFDFRYSADRRDDVGAGLRLITRCRCGKIFAVTRQRRREGRPARTGEGNPNEKQYARQQLLYRQAEGCRCEELPVPGKTLRWSAAEARRDAQTGEALQDVLLIPAALGAVLDRSLGGAE
jgi:hypothetical protein